MNSERVLFLENDAPQTTTLMENRYKFVRTIVCRNTDMSADMLHDCERLSADQRNNYSLYT